MKKVLPIILTLVLAVSSFGFAAAPAKASHVMATKSAIVQNYTETTVTVLENGKMVTYAIAEDATVTSGGMEAVYADTITKGRMITFAATAGTIKEVDIPGLGLQGQGVIVSKPVITENGLFLNNALSVADTRIVKTDSNIVPGNTASTITTAVLSGEEVDDTFLLSEDGKKADFGDMDIIAGTLVATVDGKALTIVPADAFLTATPGDEAKIVKTKTFTHLEFETPLTEAQKKTFAVTFKKQMRTLTQVETSIFKTTNTTIIELNGKVMPFVMDGTSAFVDTDLAGNTIYVNSFYKNQDMKFLGTYGNRAVVAMMRGDISVYYDSIEISDTATISDAAGEPIEIGKIKTGTMIKLTVDPSTGYKVVELSVAK